MWRREGLRVPQSARPEVEVLGYGDGLSHLPNTETDPAADAKAHAEAHAAHTGAHAAADARADVLHGLLVWHNVSEHGCGHVHPALSRRAQRPVPSSARPAVAVLGFGDKLPPRPDAGADATADTADASAAHTATHTATHTTHTAAHAAHAGAHAAHAGAHTAAHAAHTGAHAGAHAAVQRQVGSSAPRRVPGVAQPVRQNA
jgi:hypothetical protein